MPGAILRERSCENGSYGDRRAGPPSLAEFEPVALEATRPAALACQRWIGRGSGKGADAAAAGAMRAALANASGRGTVVVVEGAKDAAPMLFDSEQLGAEAVRVIAGKQRCITPPGFDQGTLRAKQCRLSAMSS